MRLLLFAELDVLYQNLALRSSSAFVPGAASRSNAVTQDRRFGLPVSAANRTLRRSGAGDSGRQRKGEAASSLAYLVQLIWHFCEFISSLTLSIADRRRASSGAPPRWRRTSAPGHCCSFRLLRLDFPRAPVEFAKALGCVLKRLGWISPSLRLNFPIP